MLLTRVVEVREYIMEYRMGLGGWDELTIPEYAIERPGMERGGGVRHHGRRAGPAQHGYGSGKACGTPVGAFVRRLDPFGS